jgi:hypothetical protein
MWDTEKEIFLLPISMAEMDKDGKQMFNKLGVNFIVSIFKKISSEG